MAQSQYGFGQGVSAGIDPAAQALFKLRDEAMRRENMAFEGEQFDWKKEQAAAEMALQKEQFDKTYGLDVKSQAQTTLQNLLNTLSSELQAQSSQDFAREEAEKARKQLLQEQTSANFWKAGETSKLSSLREQLSGLQASQQSASNAPMASEVAWQKSLDAQNALYARREAEQNAETDQRMKNDFELLKEAYEGGDAGAVEQLAEKLSTVQPGNTQPVVDLPYSNVAVAPKQSGSITTTDATGKEISTPIMEPSSQKKYWTPPSKAKTLEELLVESLSREGGSAENVKQQLMEKLTAASGAKAENARQTTYDKLTQTANQATSRLYQDYLSARAKAEPDKTGAVDDAYYRALTNLYKQYTAAGVKGLPAEAKRAGGGSAATTTRPPLSSFLGR